MAICLARETSEAREGESIACCEIPRIEQTAPWIAGTDGDPGSGSRGPVEAPPPNRVLEGLADESSVHGFAEDR